ncbi:Exodeoxyribonuclease 7 large subunit [Austwickia sp. TVS 96-490-7B]|uniref:exodeoxyribonuclease VII large subunit n=1 Tax=Austwickia sp. TVS 96-490-7B TaxID=2830843 RepID=UPI001C59369D|nr:exodeoxyribonuclease VII large subunit [Austwickia sp. TVS 96-490-7B]MBW3085875.1 Exodeoxyribonuclease 7 large subunit [Austwickia sp. TVS 96-490-7B]
MSQADPTPLGGTISSTSPTLAPKAALTTAENPWPIRLLATRIEEYVDRMSRLWVEGQVVQLSRRSGSRCFITLRDTDEDLSLTVSLPGRVLDAMPLPLRNGQRVVVHAKPTYWRRRGTLQLEARTIRPIGEGELLARIEALRQSLTAEGLCDPRRRRPLPFLPDTIGLISGRNSAAQRDVVDNARRRWPSARFEIREVPVQGHDAARSVAGALRELDALPQVDVIVIARGGGSFEDLLPFSSEGLLREVAAARTPVVSAIGHEIDTPLLDFVADLRASTPTDAAKRIVPDVSHERAGARAARHRLDLAMTGRISEQRRLLASVRSRPALRHPVSMLAPHRTAVLTTRETNHRRMTARLGQARSEIGHLRARVRALSPLSTMQRGYAVVERSDGHLVSSTDHVGIGDLLRIRFAEGAMTVQIVEDR